jgi:nitrate reductase NapD
MFLTGTPQTPTPEERRYHHISSAVVTVIPGRLGNVAEAIARMGSVEIRASENSRIVVVLEGASSGELGELLTAIGNLDGVIAANLVFEHVEELRGTGA